MDSELWNIKRKWVCGSDPEDNSSLTFYLADSGDLKTKNGKLQTLKLIINSRKQCGQKEIASNAFSSTSILVIALLRSRTNNFNDKMTLKT